MNPFAVSLAFLILIAAIFTVEIYIPLINQHLIISQENSLRSQANEIISQYRNSKTELKNKLNDLNVNGVKINSIQSQIDSDFEAITINFSHQALLFNKYFNQELVNNNQKTIHLLIDK